MESSYCIFLFHYDVIRRLITIRRSLQLVRAYNYVEVNYVEVNYACIIGIEGINVTSTSFAALSFAIDVESSARQKHSCGLH